MELRTFNRDKGPVLAAVLALLALGVGSIFLTLQNIRRQRDLVDQYMLLAGSAVVHGVEANLMRVMHSLRSAPGQMNRFFPTVEELFQEITASGDIVFLGIFDEDGHLVVASTKDAEAGQLVLPEEILAALEVKGRWSGTMHYKGKHALFSALRVRPSLSAICEGVREGLPCPPEDLFGPLGPGPRGERGMPPEAGREPRRFGREGQPPPPPPPSDAVQPDADLPGPARSPRVPSMFLVAGLSPDRHMSQFQEYQRAALLQTGYVLAAAVVLWILAFAYLRRRDQALKAARLERFHSKLLDNMPDGLVTLAPDGQILSANGSAARLLLGEGLAAADLVGRSWDEFPFVMPGAEAQGRPQWRQFTHQGRILEVMCLPLQTGDAAGGPGERLALLRDRTRIKTLEDDLAEAKRLAAIGSLAAGVAHEIRNPLSSLRGFAQLFASRLKDQEPLASYAATMVQEADRLNRVVTDLLFLARPRELEPAEVDLPRLAESLRGLLRFDLEHKGVVPALDLKAASVHADEDALRQALLNLVVNALDALPETGGSLTLASARGRDGEGGPEGVWISVADNGQGMDEEVRGRAFEPFFTAKRQGTGLGLAIVEGIMRGHRGRALIESAPGAGTAVRLFFPDPQPADSGGEPHDAESAD